MYCWSNEPFTEELKKNSVNVKIPITPFTIVHTIENVGNQVLFLNQTPHAPLFHGLPSLVHTVRCSIALNAIQLHTREEKFESLKRAVLTEVSVNF